MESWDERYTKGIYSAAGPHKLLVKLAKTVEPGNALDLACGGGRNAIFLAQQGWRVTAVDSSEVGIALARSNALVHGLTIDFIAADLEKDGFQIKENYYDLICDFFYLQKDLFEHMKNGVRVGGLVISSIHFCAENEKPRRFSLKQGELKRLFQGFKILHFQESPHNEKKDAGGNTRRTSEIIAQRTFI